LNVVLAARYPFTYFAKKYLEAGGVEKIDSELLARAKQRVVDAVEKRERRPGDARTELASYALARVLLACLARPGLAGRFGSWEARCAAEKLAEEEESVFFAVAKDFFPSLESAGGELAVSLLDYLRNGSGLVHAQLDSGKVFLSRDELTGLLREAIASKARDLPRIKPSELPALVREAAEELGQELPKETSSFKGFEGRHLALPCIQKIRSGLEEGRRYYGSMALSIACLRDGLAREEAAKVLEEYAVNCRRSTHSFTLREALASLDWVYKHPSIRFSCRTMKENGLVGEYCEACPYRNRRVGKP